MGQPQTQSEQGSAGHGLRDCGPAALGCVSFGVFFRLRIADPALRAAALAGLPYATTFPDVLPPEAEAFSLLSADGHSGFRVMVGDQITSRHIKPEPAIAQLCRDLMVHVANFAPDRVFVHAGVVGWQGRAILLPGPSFAGKTTLTAALVRAGATYYSDEYAVLDETGLVHPYARDLQMRQPGSAQQRGVTVAELNGVTGSVPLRAASVVFAHYRPGSRWVPQRVSPGMAVLEMLRHTIPVQRTPARVMGVLAAALDGASVWKSDRDEAGEVAHALFGALS